MKIPVSEMEAALKNVKTKIEAISKGYDWRSDLFSEGEGCAILEEFFGGLERELEHRVESYESLEKSPKDITLEECIEAALKILGYTLAEWIEIEVSQPIIKMRVSK